jgi:uncharacterized membrane protein
MIDQNTTGVKALEVVRNAFNFLTEFGWVIVLVTVAFVVLFIYLNRKKEKFKGKAPEPHFKVEKKKQRRVLLSKSEVLEEKEKANKSFSFEGKTLSRKEMQKVEELVELMREKAVKLSRIEMVHAIVGLGFEPRIAEEVVKRLYRK